MALSDLHNIMRILIHNPFQIHLKSEFHNVFGKQSSMPASNCHLYLPIIFDQNPTDIVYSSVFKVTVLQTSKKNTAY